MKRILLFAATNLAVLVVISVVAKVLGLDAYLAARGGSLEGLLLLSVAFGMGGALISLALSKVIARFAMGVHVIAQPRNESERRLIDVVRAHATRLEIGMPEVGVFDSPTMNAFATGANRNRALVAVSTGLLQGMRDN